MSVFHADVQTILMLISHVRVSKISLSLDKGMIIIRFAFNDMQGPKGHTSDSV